MAPPASLVPKEDSLELQQMLALLKASVALSLRHHLIFRELYHSRCRAHMATWRTRRSLSKRWLPLYLDTNFQNLLCYESNCRLPSEFPSLSGAPQTHYQNPGQAVWGNSNQRIIQHTPVQRPQQQAPAPPHNSVQQQSQQPSQNQEQPQQPREDIYSGSQLTGSSDDYHRGGQGGIGQLGASVQPQPSSIEEFPPLGRNGTDESQHDRRGSLMQSAAFGGFSNSSAFSLPPNQSQARHGLPSSQHNQSDSGRSSALDRITSPSSLSFGL